MVRFVMALVVLLVVSGCFPYRDEFRLIDSSVLNAAYQADPVPADEVGVFIADDVLPESCERVALIRAAATATVMDRLREEAGRLGANAVDLRDFRRPGNEPELVPDEAWNALALYCPA